MCFYYLCEISLSFDFCEFFSSLAHFLLLLLFFFFESNQMQNVVIEEGAVAKKSLTLFQQQDRARAEVN